MKQASIKFIFYISHNSIWNVLWYIFITVHNYGAQQVWGMLLMQSSSEVWVSRSGRVMEIITSLGLARYLSWVATSQAVSTEGGMRLARLDSWRGREERLGSLLEARRWGVMVTSLGAWLQATEADQGWGASGLETGLDIVANHQPALDWSRVRCFLLTTVANVS